MKERVLHLIVLIAVLALALSGNAVNASAQSQTAQAAFQAQLQAYNHQHQLDFAITSLREAGSLAYASAARPMPQSEADTLFLLAENHIGQGWQVRIPGESSPAEYNQILNAFPEDVLDQATKAYLQQPEARNTANADLLMANYSGHRLPWLFGKTGYVTQKDGTYHLNQVDFDIQGLAASGDVYASKPGTVVFVKDSSSTTCQNAAPDPCWKKSNMVVVQHASGEYSWYVHLAYHSAAVSVGQQIGFGTKIGVEGETGYSFGVHLHYMASSGHTTWTDPNDPDNAPWATGLNPVDFDEYSWAALVVTYASTYTSQNGANLPPICPAAGGVLLYRDGAYGCSGLLENFGYSFRNASGFQNLSASFIDLASSVRVPDGWSVLLYENADRGGGKKCVNAPGDDSFAGDAFDDGAPVNDQVSSFEVFSEPNCPAHALVDTTPPSGSLTSPASGVTVGRSVSLVASTADNASGVQQVKFLASWAGVRRVIYTDTTAPYSYDWDLCAAGVPDGSIALNIEVIDNAWNRMSGADLTITKNADCAAQPSGNWSVDYWSNPNLSGSPTLHNTPADPFLFFDWGSASPGEGILADGWSARFTRVFNFNGGSYRFHCQSDDGCRIFIDGQERISNWQEQNFGGQDWSGTLSAGSHEVRLEYYDASGGARLEAWWQGPGFLSVDAACSPGQWCVDFWGNNGLAGAPALHRDEGETLRHDWASAGPDALLPADRFSSRAARSAAFDCGTYRFHADTANAVRVLVDNAPLIDQWSEPAQPASYSQDIALMRGTHTLQVEQADTSGTASLNIWWEKVSSCTPMVVTIDPVPAYFVRPSEVVQPVVRARVTSGSLEPARGDALSFVSGSLLGAVSPQPVRSFTDASQSYTFDALNGLRMIAPTANGSYTSQWQVRADGTAIVNTTIPVTVDGNAPQVSITSPGGYLTTTTIPVRANITDSGSGVTHAQFLVGYDAGGGWAWRSLGWDFNGSDGWGIDWNTSGVADQTGIVFLVAAWDRAGNSAEARTGPLTLDRAAPSVAINPLSPTQESTRFLVEWSGSDGLSGLHHFDVQVIDNGSARAWLNSVPGSSRSAWFTGLMGHSYAFQVRAVDVAGNASAYSSPAATQVNTCTPDGYHADDDPSHATARTLGVVAQIHNLCGVGDVDWYSFTAEPGKQYLIRTDTLGATTDTVLALYAADGTTRLAENDNPGLGAQYSQLLWYTENGGLFYFTVRHVDPNVTGNAVTYNAWVAEAQVKFLPQVFR